MATKRENDKAWRERNDLRHKYNNKKGAARNFIRNHGTKEDLEDIIALCVDIIAREAWNEAPPINNAAQTADKLAKAQEELAAMKAKIAALEAKQA